MAGHIIGKARIPDVGASHPHRDGAMSRVVRAAALAAMLPDRSYGFVELQQARHNAARASGKSIGYYVAVMINRILRRAFVRHSRSHSKRLNNINKLRTIATRRMAGSA
jgi:hypothetical protein